MQLWQIKDYVTQTTKTYTEHQILEEFWTEWSQGRRAHFGAYHPLITPENCIWDWVWINDATPVGLAA